MMLRNITSQSDRLTMIRMKEKLNRLCLSPGHLPASPPAQRKSCMPAQDYLVALKASIAFANRKSSIKSLKLTYCIVGSANCLRLPHKHGIGVDRMSQDLSLIDQLVKLHEPFRDCNFQEKRKRYRTIRSGCNPMHKPVMARGTDVVWRAILPPRCCLCQSALTRI